ncbi:MAG: FecR domain-containing protein [Cyclobacteriaceae bacterium]|nr:FecR domain-containing protein [Cyclobacteriaceae bacterium]
MKYRDCTFDNLIKDELFKQWVKSPDEYNHSFWTSFIEQYPEKRSEIEKARHFILSLQFSQPEIKIPDQDQIEEEYNNLIRKSDALWKDRKLESRISNSFLLRYAAVLAIVFIFAFVWYSLQNDFGNEVLQVPEISMIERSVSRGQRLPIVLPDGTKVKLNSESRLIFPAAFSGENREVILEGEGFFEVAKDIHKPFIVKTKNMTTTVLGTSFNIKAYTDDKDVQIAVLSGKVEVKGAKPRLAEQVQESVILEPSQMVRFNVERHKFDKEIFNYRKIFSWKDNVLYFENAGFSEVIEKTGHWYGKEFEVRVRLDRVKDFTARYENQPLDMVLEGLSFAYGIHYKVEGDKVIIY